MKKISIVLLVALCLSLMVVPAFAATYDMGSPEKKIEIPDDKNFIVFKYTDGSDYYFIYDKTITATWSVNGGMRFDGTSGTFMAYKWTGSAWSSGYGGCTLTSTFTYGTYSGVASITYSNLDIYTYGTSTVFFSRPHPIAEPAQVLPARITPIVPVVIVLGLVIFSILLLPRLLKRWAMRFLPH